jgi:hypothetical protein
MSDTKNELERLKEEFGALKTEDELKAFDERIRAFYASKTEEEKESFAKAFEENATAECENAQKVYDYLNIRIKLANILDIVSMSYLAENYFHKSKSWFSQRLNGHTVNSAPVTFTEDELKILSYALSDISKKIDETARSIA